MVLDEAIKNLGELAEIMDESRATKYAESARLGVESLKREKFVREHLSPSSIELLPGETK